MNTFFMNWVIKHLPSPPCRVLDIGCSDGAFVQFLFNCGYESFGIDQHAKETERIQRVEARAFLGRTGSVCDCITLIDVLEHLPVVDLAWTFEHLKKALKPNGRLIIRTPNAESPWGSRLFFSDPEHCWAFTRQSLSKFLKDAGFSRWTFMADPIFVHGPVSLCRWLIWHTLSIPFRLLLAAETGDIHGILTSNLICIAEV